MNAYHIIPCYAETRKRRAHQGTKFAEMPLRRLLPRAGPTNVAPSRQPYDLFWVPEVSRHSQLRFVLPQAVSVLTPPKTRASEMDFGRWGFLLLVSSYIQVMFILFPGSCQPSNAQEIHAEGYCSMYGICGQRSDGKFLNCPNSTSSVKPDELLSSKIQSLCPTMTGNVCCSADQFDVLRGQVQQAIPLLVGCPACLRNFLNLFCVLACSPNQSLFINVTSVRKINDSMTVDGIDYFVTHYFGEQLFNSCKDVKFGTMNTRAMDFVGAGAQNYTDWFAFLGRQANSNQPGSPYSITFRSNISDSSGMKPMNATAYSCGDTSLGCSCGDCPASAVCTDSSRPAPHVERSCSVKFASLKVKCLDFSLAIVYLILVSAFLLWGFLYKRKKNVPSRTKSLLKVKGESSADIPEASEVVPSVVKAHRPSVTQLYMSSFFRKYGVFVTKNPTLVLGLSLVVPLLLCIGLIRFKVETHPEKLWVGPGSKAAEEKLYFDSHLAPFYRIEQFVLASISTSSSERPPNIVTEKNLKLLFEIQKKVDDLRVNYSGSMISLSDICMKPLGKDCATQSVLQYFQMDPQNYDAYGGLSHVEYCFQHFSSAENCLSTFTAPLDPSTALGGFSGNNYSEASAFVVTYPVNNVVDETSTEYRNAVAWEKAFVHLMQDEIVPLVQSQNLTLSFSSESSIQEELKRESTADAITILVSYLVMFGYISMTLGERHHLSSILVSSKVLLGLSGVVLVMLSVLGSVGFYSAIGVKSTLIIMEVIPFLVLAVGVDNMCILVHAVKRQPLELVLEERISNALMEVGPSITLASLSEVLAFAVGSFIPMPACRVFSMFAALAVLFDFILQVTAFVALIILDVLRTEDGRIDCLPCIKLRSSNLSSEGNVKQDLGMLARYMKDIHAPLLGHRGVKIIVIVMFVGFAFTSIALCTRIQPGLEQQIVLPRDSYLQSYFDDLATYLRVGPPLYFVLKNFNYSSNSGDTNQICSINQCNSNSLLNEIAKASLTPASSYIAKPAASWLDDFLIWLSPDAFSCCRKFVNGSYCPPDDQPPCCQPDDGSCTIGTTCKDCTTCFSYSNLHDGRPSTEQFKEKLPWFLNALPSSDCAKGGKGAYTTSVDLSGYGRGIVSASSFRTYHTPLNKQSDYVNSMKAALDFSSKMSRSLKIEIFPYSVFYIFFEQYLDIWKTALINISIALGAVFVVCLILTSSIWISTIILSVLVMIVIDMLGVMGILGIQLNAISVVNLVMSIGIAVEFCVHITHAFMSSTGDRGTRTKVALSTMGASVFSGITLTKLVGVIVLRFAKSEVFVVYYFQMYLALVLIGFLHGLVFLPVVLSICGPPSSASADVQQHQQTTAQTS
ncbi:Niemann-Pick C1 protein-like [Canna indica]|uniref:Niemann-Pick C1 protein-like n=1 Tax=Canna indica TaxID=4628 RepID=A0AAQ3KRR6_9LILI|nr:Niemann-Pick C1 protein-like [Canna indica]